MSYRWKLAVVVTSLLVLLFLQGSQAAVQTADLYEALIFCQTAAPKAEYNQEVDDEELFRYDSEKKKVVMRIPQFDKHSPPEAGVQSEFEQNVPVCNHNLENVRKYTNGTLRKPVPPKVTVYPEDSVEFGKPNILICFMDDFHPPVINVSWYRNGEPVSEGVSNTDFYSKANYRFRKFSYLVFTPKLEDIYSCHVEHWGLEEPINKFWEPEEPPSTSEVTGTVVCAFGLALGLVGVAIGTVLLIKGMKRNPNTRR
ncbi:RLA class II histocompatibility antigen, DP alpha-1 chain-like isoform X2 [Latimeria chalumnae]|uniref:Ig-like domain-containing protein n=1 Tax=Latimeria chalumnae TaxID=7897 RepID=H3A0M9_LATCH|nr:PREDICTED: RLA class II histocompatibility antigen, DP alpha-1 chain-like isoform X2 [Latimeria chalumnae]|eukprot:XP_006010589.1 PREDICTED: RLA class II histocompatibility antigen, DP alpha-1 chain-like isoform X2 [Latimeria chalumnae]